LATAAALLATAVPLATSGLDEMRTAMAARYVAGRIARARLAAVERSARLGIRFERSGADYTFAVYADGNRNGVRTVDIGTGTDPLISPDERLGDHFGGVQFGLAGGVPDLDGVRQPSDEDGVRMGSAGILTLGPDGTATSGTLYIRGRRGQFAVRVLGATARTRIFKYQPGADEWIPR
jgi:hypothetical protein